MLNAKMFWLRLAFVLLIVGFAYLAIPPYVEYCQSNNANYYNCAAYEIGAVFGHFVKANDAAITALATAAIAWFTWTIRQVNKSQLAHSHQVERAYISGGFGKHDPPNRLFVSIHNNGKTPAIVDYLFIDVCPLGKLPPVSEILTKRKYVNYSVPPLTRIVGIDFFATWDGAPGHIFFGRFWYTDIFGDTHESGFALHPGKPDGMPAADAPEYWKWT
jgi:hypothetical protein